MMKKIINKLSGICLLLSGLHLLFPITDLHAQERGRWSVNTNGLLWLTGSPNAGVDVAVSSHSTIGMSASYNPFTYGKDHKLRHLLGMAGYRYWLSQAYSGHYIGVYGQGGIFNIGSLPLSDAMRNYRYEGKMYGGSVSYGYHWAVTRRLNIGAELGLGYLRVDYSKYACATCGRQVDEFRTNYLGPTNLSVSLIYLLK